MFFMLLDSLHIGPNPTTHKLKNGRANTQTPRCITRCTRRCRSFGRDMDTSQLHAKAARMTGGNRGAARPASARDAATWGGLLPQRRQQAGVDRPAGANREHEEAACESLQECSDSTRSKCCQPCNRTTADACKCTHNDFKPLWDGGRSNCTASSEKSTLTKNLLAGSQIAVLIAATRGIAL